MPQVFDSFYKSNTARTNDGSGAGIGLALVKQIMRLHQGEILIESEEGKGTRVRLILPLLTQSLEDGLSLAL